MVCSNTGFFLVRHPLVPGAAMCQQCQGCPSNLCGARGCISCPVLGLPSRAAVPGLRSLTGLLVFACRGTGGPKVGRLAAVPAPPPCLAPNCHAVAAPELGLSVHMQAFQGLGTLPYTALWPVSEFATCPTLYGEFQFSW